jgi:hypothetical protein
MGEWFSEDHDYSAEEDFESRMAGVYVDLFNGEVIGGAGSIGEERAKHLVALASSVVHLGIIGLSGAGPRQSREWRLAGHDRL